MMIAKKLKFILKKCACEHMSVISRKEHRLRCPIRVLIKISGPKKEERAGENCTIRSLTN
jgi:hypothetical protein